MSDTIYLDEKEKVGFLWKSYLGFPNTVESKPFYQETAVSFNNYILGEDLLLYNIPKNEDLEFNSADIKNNGDIDSNKVNHNDCKIQNNIEKNNVKANIIRKYTKIKLEPVPGTENEGFSKGWFCLDNSGNNILSNAIQFNINQTQTAQPYLYTLYSSDGNSSDSTLTSRVTNENHGNWIFDVKNGVINFPDKPNFTLDSNKPLYLTFYRYIGDKGITNLDLKWKKNSDDENNIYYIRGKVGIGKTNPDIILDISSTDAIQLPIGNTNQRPSSSKEGMIRYNTTLNQFEGCGADTSWNILGGVVDIDMDTYINAEHTPGHDNDELKFFTDGIERMKIAHTGYINFNSRVGIGKTNPDIILDISSNDAIQLPTGNTNQRPSSSKEGMIRYNNEINQFEGCGANTSWNTLGGVIDIDKDTYITAEDSPGNDNDELKFFTNNAERMKIENLGDISITQNNSNFSIKNHSYLNLYKSIFHISRVKIVAAGPSHIAFIINTGTVMTQGRNFRGALGIGKTQYEIERSTVPVEVNASGRYDKTNAVAVGVGRYHTMIILNDGTAMGFGNNDTNQLGLSSQDTNQHTEPEEVIIRSNYPGGYNRNAISVSCSNDIIRSYSNGNNSHSFTVILLNTGKLIFCGWNNGWNNQTGYIPVRSSSSYLQPTIGEYHYGDYYAVDVKCAGQSGLVLLNSGQVLVFGYNQNKLGVRPEDKDTGGSSDTNGTQFMFPLRTDTSSYDGTNAVSIACAYNVNAVLLDTGKIVTFGTKQRHTGYPDVGDSQGDDLAPTDMPKQGEYDGTNAKSICLGIKHGLILLNDNKVISSVVKNNSAENSYGEGGRVITNGDGRNYAAIHSNVFPSSVNNIFSADYVSYFLLENGELYGCGRNNYNNVSDFNSSAVETPKSIITLQETSESYDKTNIIVFNQIAKYTYLNIKKFLINNKFTVDYAIKNKNTIENISNEFNFRDFENKTEINFSNLNFKDSIYIYSNSQDESGETLKSVSAGNSNIYLDCNNYSSLFSGSGSSNGIIWKTNYSGYTKISAAIKFVPTANYFRGDIVFYTSDEASNSAIVQERFRIKKDGDVIFTGTLNGATISSTGINGATINSTTFNGATISSTSFNDASISSTSFNGATISNNNITCNNISCKDLDLIGAINSINNRDLLIAGKVLIGSTSATMQGAVQIENSVDNGSTKVGNYFLNNSSYNHNSGSYMDNSDENGRIHVGLRVKRGIWCHQLNYDSDMRIKENIRDVSDNFALQKLRDISCVNYEYKDKMNRGFSETIGFIAQQVKEHMPIAIAIQKEIIPNEMRIIENPVWNIVNPTDVSDNKIYKLTINDLNDTSGNILYRFYVSNDISGNDECKKEIYSLEDDPKSFLFDQSWNNVFLYGKKVDDFHTLDKQKLFSLNFSATQEIDRIQQKQVVDIESLKLENMQLKTEVATLKTQMENILSRLSELESK